MPPATDIARMLGCDIAELETRLAPPKSEVQDHTERSRRPCDCQLAGRQTANFGAKWFGPGWKRVRLRGCKEPEVSTATFRQAAQTPRLHARPAIGCLRCVAVGVDASAEPQPACRQPLWHGRRRFRGSGFQGASPAGFSGWMEAGPLAAFCVCPPLGMPLVGEMQVGEMQVGGCCFRQPKTLYRRPQSASWSPGTRTNSRKSTAHFLL